MKDIIDKFEKINTSWNRYFWEYQFCKSKINFGNQGKVNYYADIFIYLKDTLVFIYDVEYFKDFHQSVFQAFGVMQTIYAHQDLIDEILLIFKIQKSIQADKNPNRQIRNELIGHPISRTDIGNEFISSIFLGNNFSNGLLNYVLYSKNKGFRGEDIYHSLDDIIERHKHFLHKYLDQIWGKITSILNSFKDELISFRKALNSNMSFSNVVRAVEHKFESIFKSDYIFEKDALLYYFSKANEHYRYGYSVELFNKTLREYLDDTISDINDLVRVEVEKEIFVADPIKFKINIVTVDSKDFVPAKKIYYDYEFSKLFERHPVFTISYFKELWKEDTIIEELNNMEINYNNDWEYYCSCEYLRKLLTDKRLLEFSIK